MHIQNEMYFILTVGIEISHRRDQHLRVYKSELIRITFTILISCIIGHYEMLSLVSNRVIHPNQIGLHQHC